ncbi:MAG TPA: sigma-70 family RNA polymerase sigma factor [Candidatus Polarisedimenticolia bacterium]|nr:sigma-70 family RNA polymerase sigma factor [Candidatus Polarisedimenticolia bacterium]
MAGADESSLIEAARDGDATAFEALVRRYDRQVLRLALRFVGEDEARDIYQEVFLKVFRSLSGFRQESSFATWLHRIATNICLDHLRRSAVRPPSSPALRDAGDDQEPLAARIADDRPDVHPWRALERREIRRRIVDGLRTLTPRERLVFEYRHFEGMRLRQIGELMETSEETVKNCLFRAHRKMRQALRDVGGVESRSPGRSRDAARAGA